MYNRFEYFTEIIHLLHSEMYFPNSGLGHVACFGQWNGVKVMRAGALNLLVRFEFGLPLAFL